MKNKENKENVENVDKTTKERLIDLLMTGRSFTAKEICDILEIESEKEVYSLLRQVSKILRRKGYTLAFTNPTCKKCGFTMDKIDAGKCPKCKSHWIEPAKFVVLEVMQK